MTSEEKIDALCAAVGDLRKEVTEQRKAPTNGASWLKRNLPTLAVGLGVLVTASSIAGALLMPRSDATAQHQAIKDSLALTEASAVMERRDNAEATRTNAKAIDTLAKSVESIQRDVRAVGRAVGARGLSQRAPDDE